MVIKSNSLGNFAAPFHKNKTKAKAITNYFSKYFAIPETNAE